MYDYDFCSALIKRFNIKTTATGIENIPKEGGFIFAANHPLGGMDAMALVTDIEPYRKDVKFVVNDILLNLIAFKATKFPLKYFLAHFHFGIIQLYSSNNPTPSKIRRS